MRRTITLAEPIHRWIQHIRGWYLQEYGIDMSYTGAVNLYLAWGLCAASRTSEKERDDFVDEVVGSEEIDIAAIQDEFDNLWLAKELPKLLEKDKK